MPTVILLDVSLSMNRQVDEATSIRQLALNGIKIFLDYLSENCKLEYVSLITFSSKYEQLVGFTRNYSEIHDALVNLGEFDKKNIENGLYGAGYCITKEWGIMSHCNIILITDGVIGIGESSLRYLVSSYANKEKSMYSHLTLPFKFPSSLFIVQLKSPTEDTFSESTSLMNQILIENQISGKGELFLLSGPLNKFSINSLFQNLAENRFSPYLLKLKCGSLECQVQMVPALFNKKMSIDGVLQEFSPSKILEICGFISSNDVSSPPFKSKHLIIPYISSQSNEEEIELSVMTPTLTVILHGSLKMENAVAIVQIAKDWFGIIYSFADSKKKSNLMLSIFEPGATSIPWLGNFNSLGSFQTLNPNPYLNNKSPFPVSPDEGRSYSQNYVVWIQNSGLQADIQKILRNARKLPEKQAHFYKELNRLRKTALSLCFYELLDSMATLLERECANPVVALQMTHAANLLRDPLARDPNQIIVPLVTHYSNP